MYELASLNPLSFYLYSRVNAAKTRYDAWWYILLLAVLALAATVYLGLMAWCVVHNHGSFTGEFRWVRWGFSLNAHCTR